METNKQKQYTKWGGFIKKILHTKIGAFLGYNLGVSGYNRIDVVLTDENGKVKKVGHSYNSRVDVGAALCAYLQCGTNLGSLSSPNYAKYIALQDTGVLSPAHTDTTLSHECVAAGLTRALATAGTWTAATALDGVASFILSKSFTNSSGGSVTVYGAGIFDAASSGNMYVEGNFTSSYSIANLYSMTVNWTINI